MWSHGERLTGDADYLQSRTAGGAVNRNGNPSTITALAIGLVAGRFVGKNQDHTIALIAVNDFRHHNGFHPPVVHDQRKDKSAEDQHAY
jgi:hypothetical protein